MKKASIHDILLLLFIGILVLTVGISIFIFPKAQFSADENRYLAVFPALSLDSLTDGSFSQGFSRYCSDRIPARQKLISLVATSERLLGKQEYNGIVFGKGGYLIPKGEYSDFHKLDANLAFIDSLQTAAASQSIPFACAIAPRSIDVNSSRLPSTYSGDYSKTWSFILERRPWITDLRDPLLSSSRSDLWYKTDHHWTTAGAFLAYVAICKNLNISPYGEEFFEIVEVCDDFFGTSSSRVGGIWAKSDSIYLYRYGGDGDFTLNVPEKGITQEGFYSFDALDGKDEYSVFLGGNYGYAEITANTNEERERLLIIKDSYANSVIPFLALHFDLTVVDPRYYSGDIFSLLPRADKILVLMGAGTLAETVLTSYP